MQWTFRHCFLLSQRLTIALDFVAVFKNSKTTSEGVRCDLLDHNNKRLREMPILGTTASSYFLYNTITSFRIFGLLPELNHSST